MKSKLRYLYTSLVLASAALLASLGPVMAACYGELSVGMGVNANQLDTGSGKIDLNQNGALGGLGAGCDLAAPVNGPVFGVLARYSFMKLVGDIGSDSIKSDRLWEVAARVGYKWHDKALPYVGIGWSGINLDLPSGLGNKSPQGLLALAGIEGHIRDGWWIRGEYSYHAFNKQDLGGGESITPDLHIFRAALVYYFNGDAPARPLK